ncbi:putative Histidine kinase [uncultured delta proteobacterium]|uniref:histidine kinase n=1 Tax=uncultured delta proteobacterium TaxID=34034 RepID=A0A212KDY4_9DELT|nr:putative Histidine kinase [uncultured delta proteobacterium]
MPTGRRLGSLRLYVSLFVGAILLAFALIFFFIFHTTMPRMLLASEDKYLSQQLKLVDGLLTAAREGVALLAEDTATWEDAALFAEGKNPDFITGNWTEKSMLESFRLNFVIVKDLAGNDLYTDFLNVRTKEQSALPPGLSRRLNEFAQHVIARYTSGLPGPKVFGKEGILFFNKAAYDIAIMPIVPSRNAAVPSGVLIMGNVLNNEYFQYLTHYDGSVFSIREDTDTSLTAANPIQHLDQDTVSTRTRLTGIDGSPLVLVMTEKRQIYTEGRRQLTLANALMVAAMVLFSLVLYHALTRMVLSPLGRLSKDIQGITEADDIDSAGIETEKYSMSREFVVLCASINSMLKKLGQSKVSLSMLHGLLNGIDAYLYVVDPEDYTILFMNEKMRTHYGLTENPVGKVCWKILQKDFTERCSFCPGPQLAANPETSVIWEENSELTGRQYRNTDCLIEWEGGRKVHLQYSVDITTIKAFEESLKRRLKQQELMAEMARGFIATASVTDLVNNALRMAGEFMGMSKIILVKREEEDVLHATHEWYNNTHECVRPEETIVPFHPGTPEYDGFITEKRPYLAYDDISGMAEFAYARGHGVRSLADVPIRVFGSFWGVLSFGVCGKPRPWTQSDLQLIMLIGTIISGVAERGIREAKLMRMSSIVESAPQFISYADQNGKLEYVSKGSEKALGYSPEELLSGGIPLIMDEETHATVMRDIFPRVAAEGNLSFELPLTLKNGERRIFSFSGFSIQEEHGIGLGAITQDVTEQRTLERDIIAAKEQAEKSNMAKSEFLSRMSHEMRTPLNAIIGMTSIATAARDLEKKQYCLDKVGEASNHLLGVINDILDMSKIEANKFELSYTEFSFEKMLMRVLNVVNFRIEEKKQTLVVTVSPDIPYSIISDEQRLAQVIANLLSNAVKFTPEQGTITLAARKTEEKDGECTLLVSVTDTGIGVPPEHQARLFNSFEQADGGISRKFGGTGLGLAISKRIVSLMGGEIRVESEAGKGSTFSFTVRAQRGAATSEGALADIDWNDLRVLLVDDAPEVGEYFSNLARNLGFACTVANSGFEALAILRDKGPAAFDIIFADWKMPGMDGIELAGKITDFGKEQPIIIMISATEWSDIEKDAKAAGVKHFVPKPLFAAAIIDAISESLGKKAVADQAAALADKDCFAAFTILLAEDIAINREIVITMLEDTGIAIDTAENGKEACELFRAAPDKYAMIFMDIHMPEVDGYEATRRIRAMRDIPRAGTVPIIAMTANVFREDIERCLAAGMNGHIGKPIDFAALMEKLRERCGER